MKFLAAMNNPREVFTLLTDEGHSWLRALAVDGGKYEAKSTQGDAK